MIIGILLLGSLVVGLALGMRSQETEPVRSPINTSNTATTLPAPST